MWRQSALLLAAAPLVRLLRNDVALHGTAEHGGDGLRVSLAVDCRWSPTAAADSDTETTPWARGWPP